MREKEPKELSVPAKIFLNNLPEELGRLNSGHLTDHEIAIMHKHGVDPVTQGAMAGMPLPFAQARLCSRVSEAMTTDIYKLQNEVHAPLMLEECQEGKNRFKSEMSELFNLDKPDTKQIDADDAEYNRLMGK